MEEIKRLLINLCDTNKMEEVDKCYEAIKKQRPEFVLFRIGLRRACKKCDNKKIYLFGRKVSKIQAINKLVEMNAEYQDELASNAILIDFLSKRVKNLVNTVNGMKEKGKKKKK